MFRSLCVTDKCMHATNLQKENTNCIKFPKVQDAYKSLLIVTNEITWKVVWITYRLGYILQRSCCPNFVRICCTMRSTATWLSPPRGMIISAYFFVGSMKSSKAGFTNFEYCIIKSEGILVNVMHNYIKANALYINANFHSSHHNDILLQK